MKSKYENDSQGLYRPEFEHDNCGVGMVANLSGEASHEIVVNGVTILKRLLHRGATGNDPETGDGARSRTSSLRGGSRSCATGRAGARPSLSALR